MKLSIVAILAAALLCACSILSSLTSPKVSPFVQVAVDVAVAQAVGTGPDAKVKAIRIKSIAQQVLAADSGTAASLAALEGVVNAKLLALNLPPSDLAAGQLLTATLAAIIQNQLSSSSAAQVTAQTQVAVAQVARDVIAATSAYGA